MNYKYLDAQNREIGPIPVEALHALRAAGSLTDNTLACPETGGPWTSLATLLGPAPTPLPRAGVAASAAIASAATAWGYLRTSPALGLHEAWSKLGPRGAREAGATMLLVTLLVVLGCIMLSDSFILIRPGNPEGWFKLILALVGSAALFVGVSYAARRMAGTAVGIECDVLVTGAASLLAAIVCLVYCVAGLQNIGTVAGFAPWALSLASIQYFVGFTRLGGVLEVPTSLLVPVVILGDALGAKLMFSAIY